MTRWEYKLWQVPAGGFRGGKIEGSQVVQGLNALGAEGWELVGMTETNYYEGATRDLFFVFKREMDGRTPAHPPIA